MIKNWTRTEVFGPIIILDWSDRRSSPLIVCNKHIFISGNPAVEAGSLTTQINFAKSTAAVNIFDRRVVVQANQACRQKTEPQGARYGRSRVIGHEMLLSRSRSSRSMGSVYLDGSASNDPRRSPSGIDAGALHHGTSVRLSIFPSLLL